MSIPWSEEWKEEELIREARRHGIPTAEVLKAWQEMRAKYRFPWYVEPTLDVSVFDGTIMLQPAVTWTLLPRVEREVLGFLGITGPVWPGKVVPEIMTELLPLMAETEGSNPIKKFCCRLDGECAPKELLEEGRFSDRMCWLREHYKTKHPSLWGKPRTGGERLFPETAPESSPTRLIGPIQRKEPPKELEFFADSPDHIEESMNHNGLRSKLDKAFQEAIAKAKGLK